MLQATQPGSSLRQFGVLMMHLAHGALLVVGLVVVGFLGVQYYKEGRQGLSTDRLLSGFKPAPVVTQPIEVASVSFDEEVTHVSALTPEMRRVAEYLSRRYRVSEVAIEPLLVTAQQAGRTVGIDPMLLIAVMAIESSLNPFAESPMGAQGLMQVMPRFHLDKIGPEATAAALFDPATNIRVGAMALKEAIRKTGSLEKGLRQYGGVSTDYPYASKVIAEKTRIVEAARNKRSSRQMNV